MKQLIVAAGILFGAVLLFTVIVNLKEAPPQEPRASKPYPVRINELTPVERRVEVSGYGTVQARREVKITPEVQGKIVWVNPRLEPGALVEEGEELFKIDQTEYLAGVEVARGGVARAEFELELEKGNQIVAKKEWALLEKQGQNSNLALRQPHLEEKLAALSAARANLELAKLKLQRTILVAPFKSLIVETTAEVGQYVQAGASAGLVTVVGSESFEVEVKIPREDAKWVLGRTDIEVSVKDGQGNTYPGVYISAFGDLDETGKQARALIEVPEPLDASPPLLLNSFVEVVLRGETIPATISVPATAVREGETLWVMSEGSTLEYLKFNSVFQVGENIVGTVKQSSPVKVITSSVETPLQGMKVEEIR